MGGAGASFAGVARGQVQAEEVWAEEFRGGSAQGLEPLLQLGVLLAFLLKRQLQGLHLVIPAPLPLSFGGLLGGLFGLGDLDLGGDGAVDRGHLIFCSGSRLPLKQQFFDDRLVPGPQLGDLAFQLADPRLRLGHHGAELPLQLFGHRSREVKNSAFEVHGECAGIHPIPLPIPRWRGA